MFGYTPQSKMAHGMGTEFPKEVGEGNCILTTAVGKGGNIRQAAREKKPFFQKENTGVLPGSCR
jgi:hypothetical protein